MACQQVIEAGAQMIALYAVAASLACFLLGFFARGFVSGVEAVTARTVSVLVPYVDRLGVWMWSSRRR